MYAVRKPHSVLIKLPDLKQNSSQFLNKWGKNKGGEESSREAVGQTVTAQEGGGRGQGEEEEEWCEERRSES